jgi:hypothetical protein
MSLDFAAVIVRAFDLARFPSSVRTVLGELVGVEPPPGLRIRAGARMVRDGHRARRPMFIGPGHRRLTFALADDRFDDTVIGFAVVFPDDWRLVVSPRRDGRSIVTGLGVALAAAMDGDGTLIDDDLRLIRPPEPDPHRFLASTRADSPSASFDAACLAYLRRFDHLDSWPTR